MSDQSVTLNLTEKNSQSHIECWGYQPQLQSKAQKRGDSWNLNSTYNSQHQDYMSVHQMETMPDTCHRSKSVKL